MGAAALSPWLARADQPATEWAMKGFLAMALPGILGGIWLAREHGRSGSRFLVAWAAGLVTRLVLAAIVAFGAARAGSTASIGLVAGLAAGFAPLMVLEMIWFSRAPIVPERRRG
jgi:hypothetical protein